MSETPRGGNLALTLHNTNLVECLRSRLEAVPEVRVERIHELRQAISEGRFAISAERIAEAMLAASDTLLRS